MKSRKKKQRYWKCNNHNAVGNTDCCMDCVREFIENLKYMPWYKEFKQ